MTQTQLPRLANRRRTSENWMIVITVFKFDWKSIKINLSTATSTTAGGNPSLCPLISTMGKWKYLSEEDALRSFSSFLVHHGT